MVSLSTESGKLFSIFHRIWFDKWEKVTENGYMETQNHRYHLSTAGRFAGRRQTESQALSLAFHIASTECVPVKIWDLESPVGGVDLWEMRPFEMFPRALQVKAANDTGE